MIIEAILNLEWLFYICRKYIYGNQGTSTQQHKNC